MRKLFIILALVTWGAFVSAEEWNEARYHSILSELRCLVCQNQSLVDSDASLAVALRQQVKTMLAAGESDDEIRAFMTKRYGDFVLYDPPLTPRTYVLWGAPAILLLLFLWKVSRHIIRRQSSLMP